MSVLVGAESEELAVVEAHALVARVEEENRARAARARRLRALAIRQAQLRGVSQRRLADLLGTSSQRVGQYVKDAG